MIRPLHAARARRSRLRRVRRILAATEEWFNLDPPDPSELATISLDRHLIRAMYQHVAEHAKWQLDMARRAQDALQEGQPELALQALDKLVARTHI